MTDDLDGLLDYVERYMAARRAIAAGVPALERDELPVASTEPPPAPAPTRPRTGAERIRAVLDLPRPGRPPPRRRLPPLHVRLGPPPRPRTTLRVPAGALAPWERWDKKETHMQTCKNGHIVTPGDKFCSQCGAPAATRCASCGQAIPAGYRPPPRARDADDRDDEDRGPAFAKAADRDAAAALLPGVGDIPSDMLLFKATLADSGPHQLSTHDVARLESYVADGCSLYAIAARDPGLATRIHRAVMLAGQ
jgi:hypothetical protein